MLLALPGDSIALQCQIAGHGVRLGFSGAMPTDGYHFLFFPEICLCLLVLTTWGLALGMFREHTQSIFSLPILANTPTGPKKCRRKNYVSSLHSRTLVAPARTLLASLLFSLLPSSLLKVLPLRGPGRSDQSPLVPLLVLFVPSPHSPGRGQSLRW